MAVVPTPSRQGRAYAQDEIEQLLRDALATLTADGTPFRDLSVERLLAASGIARSTFYKYFADKGALLQALSAGTLRRLYDSQRSWLRRRDGLDREEVTAAMRTLLDAHRADAAIMRAVAEAAVYDARVGDAYRNAVRDYARATERFIRAGQKAGFVKPCRPADTATALTWMVERTVSQADVHAGARRRDAVAAALANVVCETLLA